MAPTDLVDDETTDEEYEPRCRRCWDDGIVDDDDGRYGMATCPSCGGASASSWGATTVETIAGVFALAIILLFVLVLLKGWPGDGASVEEQRKTRHAICEVLAVSGADADSAADVEACTFPEEGES